MARPVLRFFVIVPAAIALVVAAGTTKEIFLKEETDWRAQREASLKQPNGWLSVAGLFWLHDGAMIVGSDPQADIVLPASAPKRAGVLTLRVGAATFDPTKGVNIAINGKPPTKAALRPDTDEHPDVIQIGSIALTIIRRGDRTGVRMRDPDAATRRNFSGCKWFPISPAWRVKAKWVAYPEPKKIKITNILTLEILWRKI